MLDLQDFLRMGPNTTDQGSSSPKSFLTLFYTGSGTYVVTRGGAIMARIDFRPYKCTKLPLGAQNWFPNKYYDLWLSIDTKNSLFITGLP